MKNKGITLVALVVTVVIVLVISGVALNLAIGENGLITKAKETKNVYDNAVAKDQEDLARFESEIASIVEELPDIDDVALRG